MENPHDGEQIFFCVLDMNTPDIHFNLQNTTFYYACLSWFVLKMSCLFCTLENMHWFTIINNIRQLHWLSLWLQSKLQILPNENVALKNADCGWRWRLQLIFYRPRSLLLNHLPPSDHTFFGLRLVYCRKRKGRWFSHFTKEVGKHRVVNDQSLGLTKSD
jgi:hypothetical protein